MATALQRPSDGIEAVFNCPCCAHIYRVPSSKRCRGECQSRVTRSARCASSTIWNSGCYNRRGSGDLWTAGAERGVYRCAARGVALCVSFLAFDEHRGEGNECIVFRCTSRTWTTRRSCYASTILITQRCTCTYWLSDNRTILLSILHYAISNDIARDGNVRYVRHASAQVLTCDLTQHSDW